jgi:hydroxypyruvate isomerase
MSDSRWPCRPTPKSDAFAAPIENGEDIAKVLAEHAGKTAHVQIADAPGRGEPGTGGLGLDRYLNLLPVYGYDGWVGLEYKPVPATLQSLYWLPPGWPRTKHEMRSA